MVERNTANILNTWGSSWNRALSSSKCRMHTVENQAHGGGTRGQHKASTRRRPPPPPQASRPQGAAAGTEEPAHQITPGHTSHNLLKTHLGSSPVPCPRVALVPGCALLQAPATSACDLEVPCVQRRPRCCSDSNASHYSTTITPSLARAPASQPTTSAYGPCRTQCPPCSLHPPPKASRYGCPSPPLPSWPAGLPCLAHCVPHTPLESVSIETSRPRHPRNRTP